MFSTPRPTHRPARHQRFVVAADGDRTTRTAKDQASSRTADQASSLTQGSTPGRTRRRVTGRPTSVAGKLGRAAVAMVVGLMALVVGAGPAWGHAELTTTEPIGGGVVAESPSEVVLVFSESVTVEADGVRVLDSDGKRRDAGTAAASGTAVTAPLEGELGQGGYVVAWRIISADGHAINGAYQFSVGMRTQVDADVVDGAFGGGSDTRDRQFGFGLRVISYVCTLLAAGITFVGARLRRPDEPAPVTRWVALLAAVGVVAIVLQVPVQTSLMTGRGWGSVTEAGVLGRALSDGLGWSVGINVLGLVMIAITAGLPFKGPVPPIALGGSVLAPLGFVVFGHTRTMSSPLVAYVSDAAHVLAAALWFGGLVALITAIRRRRSGGDVLGAGQAVGAFSGLAGVGLAAVAVSGLAMGWIEVGGLEALTDTTYGRLLMLKVGLVGLVVLGGTWNRYRLVPHLAVVGTGPADAGPGFVAPDGAVEPGPADPGRGSVAPGHGGEPGQPDEPDAVGAVTEVDGGRLVDEPVESVVEGSEGSVAAEASGGSVEQSLRWQSLVRILRLEVVLLVAAIAVTGVLVNETPAKQAISTLSQVEAPFGEGTMELWLSPGRAGLNDVHVILLDADGVPDERFDEAEFALSLPAQDVGPIKAEPVKIGPGHFQLVAADMSIRGEWAVTVSVRPDRFTLTEGTASFRIS